MGSLGPTFVPARPVRLAVKLPCCPCALRPIAIRPEGTIGRLRYPLGGDRPSQTPHQPRSPARITGRVRTHSAARVVFHRRLPRSWRPGFPGSHLSYTSRALAQRQVGVKLHGVFLSCRGSPVSSPVTSISPGPPSRQRPDRSTFRAGRNLPDKEFRYLRTVIVTAAVYRGFGSELAPLPLTFRHWAGLSPYTSTLARWQGPVFLVNSRLGLVTAAPSRSTRAWPLHATGAPLLPKLRGQFAEFLDGGSPVHLGMLYQPTCVGLRYGRRTPWLEAFLGSSGSIPAAWAVARAFPSPLGHRRSGFACRGLPTGLDGLAAAGPTPLRPPIARNGRRRDGNLDPLSIAYASRPRLRPASPAADQHGCGTLGHSVGGIRTPLALLMPTFALPAAPAVASQLAFSADGDAPLPCASSRDIRGFGART